MAHSNNLEIETVKIKCSLSSLYHKPIKLCAYCCIKEILINVKILTDVIQCTQFTLKVSIFLQSFYWQYFLFYNLLAFIWCYLLILVAFAYFVYFYPILY